MIIENLLPREQIKSENYNSRELVDGISEGTSGIRELITETIAVIEGY